MCYVPGREAGLNITPNIFPTPNIKPQSSVLPPTLPSLPQTLLCYWEHHWGFEGHCDYMEHILKIPAKQAIVEESKSQGN